MCSYSVSAAQSRASCALASPAPPAARRLRHAFAHLGEQLLEIRLDVDLGKALVILDVLAPADDTVGERNARRAAPELAYLEACGALAHIEAAAIAFGRDEYLVVAAVDHLGEVRIELYDRASAPEL